MNPYAQVLMGGPRRQMPIRPSVFQQPVANGAPGAWYQPQTVAAPAPEAQPQAAVPDNSGLADALMGQGLRGGPVQTPLEGVGNLAQALSGAYIKRSQQDAEAEQAAAQNAAIGDFLMKSGGLPEGYDPSAMPASVNQAVLASILQGKEADKPLTNSNIGTFMTPDGPRTMTIDAGLTAGYSLVPDGGSQGTAEIVTGADLGLGGDYANRPFEIERDASGNITNYSALGSGGTNVTVTNNPGDVNFSNGSKFEDKLNQNDADYITSLDTAAASAQSLRSSIANIRDIGFETGPGTTISTEVAGVMQAVGMGDLAEQYLGVDLNKAQPFASLANNISLAMKDVFGLTGVMSDSDLALLKSLGPGPENTALANQIIMGALDRAAQLKIAEADLADRWASTYGTMRNKGEGLIEGDDGMTGRQWIRSQLDALAGELKAQEITANRSNPAQINGKSIDTMTLEELQGVDMTTLTPEQLQAASMRWSLLNGGQ